MDERDVSDRSAAPRDPSARPDVPVRRPRSRLAALALAGTLAALCLTTSARADGVDPTGGAGGGSAPGPVPADGMVTLTGSGFGHGVGMSQYGAYGMAEQGSSASAILRHYYAGTSVEGYPDNVDVRVNVVDRGSRVTLRTTALASDGGAFQLFLSDGQVLRAAPGDSATVTPTDGGLTVAVTRGDGTTSTVATASLGVRWSGARAMSGPATVLAVDSRSANATSSTGKSRQYRWGSLSLSSVRRTDSDGAVRSRIEANALLNLHREYLRGIAEVPFSWPDATLRSQVVAARNYALGQVGHTLSGCGGCNLWDDTRSQVYRGWETESVGARWVQAVTATQTSRTRGLAVLYQGKPITAYYSSSTGGRTRSSAQVWGTAVPYLRSVDDPWSTDPSVNPRYASWSRSVPVAKVIAAFGLPDLVSLTVTERDAAGAVTELRATASDGTARTLPGSVLRGSTFGLPAQWLTAIALPKA